MSTKVSKVSTKVPLCPPSKASRDRLNPEVMHIWGTDEDQEGTPFEYFLVSSPSIRSPMRDLGFGKIIGS